MTLNDFVGVPYLDRGRNVEGCDCWGLVCLVYAQCLGVELPTYRESYGPISERDARDIARLISDKQSDFVQLAGEEEPTPYDLVLLNIGGVACHIGIYAGPSRMLHVTRGTTSVIESLARPQWWHRVEGFYRYAPG